MVVSFERVILAALRPVLATPALLWVSDVEAQLAEPSLFSQGLLTWLVIVAAVAFIVLSPIGRWLRVASSEIVTLIVLVVASAYLSAVVGLDSYPALLVAMAAAAAWLVFRRATRAAATAARRNESPREQERHPATPVPARAGAPVHQHSVFISYRRSDSADVTGRIHDRLVARFGHEHVFKDVDTVPLGVDFRKYLDELVGQCHALIAVIGRDWLSAAGEEGRRLDDPHDLVRIEIATALDRDVPVIPLLVRGAAMPSERELPEDLRGLAYRNGIAVRADPDFHKDVDRLIAGLESHLAG